MANEIKIAGKFRSATTEGILADASQIQQKTGQTVEQAINELDNKTTTADSDISNLNANTGIDEYEEFSDQKAYSAGDTVKYNGLLYTFTTDHVAGAWDESQVENTSLVKARISQNLGFDNESTVSQKTITKIFEKSFPIFLRQGDSFFNNPPKDATIRVTNIRAVRGDCFKSISINSPFELYIYVLDGEGNVLIRSGWGSSYQNFDNTKYYVLKFRKNDDSAINIEDVINNINITYNNDIATINEIIFFKDISSSMEVGYYSTTINNPLPEKVVSGNYRSYKADNVQIGDKYYISGTSGTTGRLWAKIKDGIVIETSDEGADGTGEFFVEKTDETFDTLVFNAAVAQPYDLKVYLNRIEDLDKRVTENTNNVKTLTDDINGLKDVTNNPFANANIIIAGDSAVAASQWAQRLCQKLNCKNYAVFGFGGYTIRTQLNSGSTPQNCLRYIIEEKILPKIEEWDNKIDIILFQIGGNDIGSVNGSIEEAFTNTNYLSYKNNLTTYGSARYCYELIKRKYPNALFLIGTVFGRLGSNWSGNAESINELITSMANNLKIQIIDGGTYCGFAPILEPVSPYYNDGTPGVTDDRTNLSRENPAYNYVDSENNIVTYDVATENGALKDGYSKRYGLYTYDSKHQNENGENKVLQFMHSALKSLYTVSNV